MQPREIESRRNPIHIDAVRGEIVSAGCNRDSRRSGYRELFNFHDRVVVFRKRMKWPEVHHAPALDLCRRISFRAKFDLWFVESSRCKRLHDDGSINSVEPRIVLELFDARRIALRERIDRSCFEIEIARA